MIKHAKKLVIMTVLTLSLLASCGPAKPTAEDAENYVKALLDVICIGDYDHSSVELVDIEDGKEAELRDSLIEDLLDEFESEYDMSEEVRSDFREFMISAFEKSKYTVGEATATDDGGFDVPVSIEPMLVFDGIEDKMQAAIEEKSKEEIDSILAMSDEELNNYSLKLAIELMNENLENPKYEDPQEVTLHYCLIDEEENIYGCKDEEGEKVGELLFSNKGIE